MVKNKLIALAAAAGIALSSAAWAQQAFTTRTANVRAGPDREFPLVATLPPGASVYIAGCVADYRWCDVDFGGGRGWVSTRSLQSTYSGSVVPLYSYGAQIGLPIISFSLLNYWDSYYRNRPFYRERPRWESRWRDDRWRDGDHRPRYDNRPSRPDYRPARPDYRPAPPQYRPPHVEAPRPQYNNPPHARPDQNRPQVQRSETRPSQPPQQPRGTGRMSNRDSEPSREHQGQ
jgi:uncharacterized protein YraI